MPKKRKKKRKQSTKPQGYLVWGRKIKRGGRTGKGRQLGSSVRRRTTASKEAREWRGRGYVASVQVTFRKPKR